MTPSPRKRPRSPSPSSQRDQATEDGDITDVSQLRKLARQSYLARREVQKLQELREEIRDEKTLFRNEQLTERERKALQLKEDIYRLAVERVSVGKDAQANTYLLPDSNGVHEESNTNTNSRYSSTVEDTIEQSDTAQWETDQIRKGRAGVGGVYDAKGQSVTTSTSVALDQLDFQLSDNIPGLSLQNDGPKAHDTQVQQEKNKDHKTPLQLQQEKLDQIQNERQSLPMFTHRHRLMETIRKNQVVIVQSETGSGKTTQIPQYLVEDGFGRVVCTQPRRVAAMSVASRVASEMGVRLGGRVGYSIRFEDCSSDDTEIKFVTDGMLLREFLSQPDLANYRCIMIDEAHERCLHTDIVMGLIKDIARHRGDDVRIIISSATMNTEKFSAYFDNAPVFKVPGRRFDVDIFYTKAPEADYLDAACVTVLQIHASQPRGDILVFLTGQDEIEAAEELLRDRTKGLGTKLGEILIAPIYATLPADQQARIFETTPPGARKVVLATNIAETSVTIPGIVYVIDPGLAKIKRFDARSGVDSLLVAPVSRAGAKQRAGRAGRIQPGKCFRLYTKWSYEHEMDEETAPELLRSNLSQVVLLMLSLGIDNLIQFDFLDPPPPQALQRSLEHLYALGALSPSGQLTRVGRRMAELPLEPMTAKALIASEQYGCSEEVAIICAMLSVNNAIFYRPKTKKLIADTNRAMFARAGGGDHMTLLRCYVQWRDASYSNQWCFDHFVQPRSMKRARDILDQLDGLLDRVDIKRASVGAHYKTPILKAFTAGFFYHACRLQKNGHYRTLKNPHTVHIHPSSTLAKSEIRPRWLVFYELVFTSKEYMRQCFDIDPQWLHEVAPHFYQQQDVADTVSRKMPKMVGKAGAKIR